MTDHVAPQEDQLVLPAAWNAKPLPWRGRRAGNPAAPADPEALVRHRELITAREATIRAALATGGNAPYAADAEAYLEGKPDPRGAAAVATLILDYDRRAHTSMLYPEFACWLQEHGLAFAVAAAVERLALAPVTDGYYGGAVSGHRIAKEHEVEHPETCDHELAHGGIAAVRSTLAAASDEEYAEAVAAVAAHRDTAPKRIAAMLLLPTETDWVLEACADYGKARHWASADLVVAHAASRPEHLAAAGITEIDGCIADVDTLAVLLGGLGTDALPVLLETHKARHYYNDDFRKQLYRAIALIPLDDATAFVFAHLDSPNVWEAATEAAARFPVRALRAAARLAPTANADVRLWTAAVVNRIDPALHVHVSEADRSVLADLLTGDGRVPSAAPEDLPPLLVAPPWTRKRPKAKPVVIEGLEPPAESHVAWTEAEQDRWNRTLELWIEDPVWIDARDLEPWQFAHGLAYATPERAEALLERWQGEADASWSEDLLRVLARYGDRVIDRVLKVPAADHRCDALPGPILNLTAARIAAERLERLRSARPSAVGWFRRHGLAAVPYLVPDALGTDKRLRRYAEFALAHLASLYASGAVTAGAAEYGAEAAEAITALLEADPVIPRVKVPQPGNWVSPLILPQVLLKDGERALPAESIPHLITVLALGTPEYDYAGVVVVAEACDRASLARFSRALFDRWTAIGAPAKDSWALTQLIHFADDATVWTLAPRIRDWPGEGQHRRAVAGLEVLGAIGTEEALRAVKQIADKVKFKALKAEATRQIEAIAGELGLDQEQLSDRLVPDFGLGDKATIVLDYGTRAFTVAFDEHLRPFVIDESGKPRKSLPKPGAKDAPGVADDAYARFTALKRELKAVAAEQVSRLEAAMVDGRAWSAAEFRRYFAEHPLTGHLARRLVWLAGDAGFRIAEDGSFSDADDEAFTLADDATVRLAHAVHLGHRLADWAELFADYEILQPFPQLARPVFAFTEDDLATGRLERFEGATVEVGRLLGMTRRGWRRAEPRTGGMCPGLAFALPGGGFATVAVEPGIAVGYPAEYPQQTVRGVHLVSAEAYPWHGDPVPVPPKNIDAVAASEILAALSRLTSA
ncbi:DUF4132 domain-containing protein [Glycomyces luteolus]|uniref:DUF4132 domain-containing protein n=1 Tax=Glycomyces luteolus TaxID=2670330 RepID=A0A9X3P8A3_9ACTN|nr:DUF4132 domain-containing protein [Glycomyces luteolus]MDA1359934.1 DUF4132 domain-containing protein [Glycomyces luteolus]